MMQFGKLKLLSLFALAAVSLTAALSLLPDCTAGVYKVSAEKLLRLDKTGEAPPDMASIPAGCFQMGGVPGDGECKADEKPRHEVCLDQFFMDKYEVSNEKYDQCVRAGKCVVAHYTGRSCWVNNRAKWEQGVAAEVFRKSAHPVVCVDWNQAKSYCEWVGKRLPTEAEWEYAARGGLDGKLYAWGSERPSASNRNLGNLADETKRKKYSWGNTDEWIFRGYDDGYADTAPVGKFKPNGYGLFDMTGNVWEWTADRKEWDYYSRNPRKKNRIMRGGSWKAHPHTVRVSDSGWFLPSYNTFDIGFRCISAAGE